MSWASCVASVEVMHLGSDSSSFIHSPSISVEAMHPVSDSSSFIHSPSFGSKGEINSRRNESSSFFSSRNESDFVFSISMDILLINTPLLKWGGYIVFYLEEI